MHQFACADNRIHRAGCQAFEAPDAAILINERHRRRAFLAILRIEWKGGTVQQGSQRGNGSRASRRALVDLGSSLRNRFGVRLATLVAAARALSLRQESIYVRGGEHVVAAGWIR
jgi:hypothetical protein